MWCSSLYRCSYIILRHVCSCFRQTQVHCTAVPREWLWVPGVWQIVRPGILSPLQKMKKNGPLPVEEKWRNYLLPNHSAFAPIVEEQFLEWIRVHAAFEKMTKYYLKIEFRTNARRFPEEFASTVLSTVTARSKLCQRVSCFCQEVIIRGHDYSDFLLSRQLFNGLVQCGW